MHSLVWPTSHLSRYTLTQLLIKTGFAVYLNVSSETEARIGVVLLSLYQSKYHVSSQFVCPVYVLCFLTVCLCWFVDYQTGQCPSIRKTGQCFTFNTRILSEWKESIKVFFFCMMIWLQSNINSPMFYSTGIQLIIKVTVQYFVKGYP